MKGVRKDVNVATKREDFFREASSILARSGCPLRLQKPPADLRQH